MDKSGIALKELKEKLKRSSYSKSKTPKQKRQDKIDKLESNPKLWKFLEQYLNESEKKAKQAFDELKLD